ncbi:MAG: type II toxin-antitoxin system HipA family toxin [Bacteroidetes bacterium]|nr:MAG: type II toxin-antitoxin system HipA family toxin [Bacteroidota bacterium]
MGTLHSELLRGKEVFSFEYENAWLQSEYAQVLDPDLDLYEGLHYLNEGKPNFGLFLDSSPDRWGRILMRKREAALARMEERSVRNLFETDYLLGVYDGHRMGGLRFKLEMNGPFLNNNKGMASPPWTSIRALEEISLRLENDEVVNDPEYLKWLSMLVAPGSSLGGARPKASIIDEKGQLWIAKFPSGNDHFDVGAWEMVTYELAKAAGINMAECRAQQFSSKHHTFLTKRFDRSSDGQRIHFASAMTMLGFADGQDGASYLDIVDFLTSHGRNVKNDLKELWRRIVFNISVSNTDDHLRNHGFILHPEGWVLSPAYDINPVETGTGLSLNISESDNTLDFDLALKVKNYFRLDEEEAHQIISEVTEAVINWKAVAKKYGISNAECELKSRAFKAAH